MSKNYRSFTIDILGCRVYPIFDKNWRKLAKKLAREKFDSDYEPSRLTTAVSFCVSNNNIANSYYMLFPQKPSNVDIYHECTHVLLWILKDFEWDLSQEPVAYLMGYIIDETFKIKRKK